MKSQAEMNAELITAIRERDLALTEELIMRGADVNHFHTHEPEYTLTPLLYGASSPWSKDMVELLLRHKASVDARAGSSSSSYNVGNNATINAIYHNDLETVTLLLQHKASLHLDDKDIFFESPLDVARKQTDQTFLRLLEDAKSKISSKP